MPSRSEERPIIRRAATALAWAFWLGGFTFYATVVIPVGTEVLGGSVAQGFVTQSVTERLNLIAVAAIAMLAWNTFGQRSQANRRVRKWLWITWAVMLVCQVALFAIHPSLDRLLDAGQRVVVEHDRFYAIHRAYLLVTTAQWIAGVAHLVLAVQSWRLEDQVGR